MCIALPLPPKVPVGTELYLLDHEDAPALSAQALSQLSEDEQAKCMHYRQTQHAQRYAATRLILRALLAERTGLATAQLKFKIGRYGKPTLSSAKTHPQHWHFNISHAQHYSMIALSPTHALGIDIEAHNPSHPIAILTSQIATPQELAVMARTRPSPQQLYALWTAKEAVVKAWGIGLGAAQEFSVLRHNNDGLKVISHQRRINTQAWRIQAPAGYAATLAIAT